MEESRDKLFGVIDTLPTSVLQAGTASIECGHYPLLGHFDAFPDDVLGYRGLEARLEQHLHKVEQSKSGVAANAAGSTAGSWHRQTLVAELCHHARVLISRVESAALEIKAEKEEQGGMSQGNAPGQRHQAGPALVAMQTLLQFCRTAAMATASQSRESAEQWLQDPTGTNGVGPTVELPSIYGAHAAKPNENVSPWSGSLQPDQPPASAVALRALLRCSRVAKLQEVLVDILPQLTALYGHLVGIKTQHNWTLLRSKLTSPLNGRSNHTADTADITLEWLLNDIGGAGRSLATWAFARDAGGRNTVSSGQRLDSLLAVVTAAVCCAETNFPFSARPQKDLAASGANALASPSSCSSPSVSVAPSESSSSPNDTRRTVQICYRCGTDLKQQKSPRDNATPPSATRSPSPGATAHKDQFPSSKPGYLDINAWALQFLNDSIPSGAAAGITTPGAGGHSSPGVESAVDEVLLHHLNAGTMPASGAGVPLLKLPIHAKSKTARHDKTRPAATHAARGIGQPDVPSDRASTNGIQSDPEPVPRVLAVHMLMVEIDGYFSRHLYSVSQHHSERYCPLCKANGWRLVLRCLRMLRTILRYFSNSVRSTALRSTASALPAPLRILCAYLRLPATLLRLAERYLSEVVVLNNDLTASGDRGSPSAAQGGSPYWWCTRARKIVTESLVCCLIIATGAPGGQLGIMWASERALSLSHILIAHKGPNSSSDATGAALSLGQKQTDQILDVNGMVDMNGSIEGVEKTRDSDHNPQSQDGGDGDTQANVQEASEIFGGTGAVTAADGEVLSTHQRQLVELHALLQRLDIDNEASDATKLSASGAETSEKGSDGSGRSDIYHRDQVTQQSAKKKKWSQPQELGGALAADSASGLRPSPRMPEPKASLLAELWGALACRDGQRGEEAAWVLLKLLLEYAPAGTVAAARSPPTTHSLFSPGSDSRSNGSSFLSRRRLKDVFEKGGRIASGVYGSVYVAAKCGSRGAANSSDRTEGGRRIVAVKELQLPAPKSSSGFGSSGNFCSTLCRAFAEISVLLALRTCTSTNRIIDFGLVRSGDSSTGSAHGHSILPSLAGTGVLSGGTAGNFDATTGDSPLTSGASSPNTDADACLWIVLEHGRESLRAWRRRRIAAETPVALASVLRVFLRVCAAVDECHRCGVTHYDLKCDNILVKEASTPRASLNGGQARGFGVRKSGSGGHAQKIRELKALKAAQQVVEHEASGATTSRSTASNEATRQKPRMASSALALPARSSSDLSFFKGKLDSPQNPQPDASPAETGGTLTPRMNFHQALESDTTSPVSAPVIEDVQVSLIDFGEARICRQNRAERLVTNSMQLHEVDSTVGLSERNFFHRGTECIRSPEMLLMEGSTPQQRHRQQRYGNHNKHRRGHRRGSRSRSLSRNRFRRSWGGSGVGGTGAGSSFGGSSGGSAGSDSLYDVLEDSIGEENAAMSLASEAGSATVSIADSSQLAQPTVSNTRDRTSAPTGQPKSVAEDTEVEMVENKPEHTSTADDIPDSDESEGECDSDGSQNSRDDNDDDKLPPLQPGTDYRSDIWSLGCLLFELATGEYLFADPDWARFYQRVTGVGFGGWRRTTPTHAGGADAAPPPGSSLQLVRLADRQLLQRRCACTAEQAERVADVLQTYFLVRDPRRRASLARCHSEVAALLATLEQERGTGVPGSSQE